MSGPNIFVGCGGSGINTLIRLNELLSEDTEWRGRMDTDVYYVVVDTNTSDLARFGAAIREHARGARAPYVASIPIARGVAGLHEVVYKYFRPTLPEGGTMRHQDHWWRGADGQPFIAYHVRPPVTDGAGQCPAIAYLLTWKELGPQGAVDMALQDVLTEITRRRPGHTALENARFSVVAGLAGGTGRGSWTLMAFKLREFMEAQGQRAINSAADLSDASVFDNVVKIQPTQRIPLAVNSLTGVSELSAWMHNTPDALDGEGYPYPYRLPNLERPFDESADVLTAYLDRNPRSSRPVDEAILVFRRSDVAVLEDCAQLQEMVGTCLYAKTTIGHLADVGINQVVGTYYGTAAATFEVPATQIRHYFETRVRMRMLERLEECDPGAMRDAAGEVLEDLGLLLRADADHRSEYRADDKGDLLQRALHFIQRERQPSLNNLKKALDEDDPDAVKDAIEAALNVTDQDVQTGLRHAVSEMFGAATEDEIHARLEARVRTALEGTVLSGQAATVMLREVQRRLQKVVEALPSDSAFADLRAQPVQDWAEARRKEFLGLWGEHFNAYEKTALTEGTRRGIWAAAYPTLRGLLRDQIGALQVPIARWIDAAGKALSWIDRLEGEWRDDLERTVGAGDPFHQLFTDPAAPDRSLPDKFSTTSFYRRELRPVLTRAQERSLLDEVTAQAGSDHDRLRGAVALAIFDPQSGLAEDDVRRGRKFADTLGKAISESFHLPATFAARHFGLRHTVEELVQAWETYLNTIGDSDRLGEKKDQFTRFFGIPVEQRDGEVRIRDAELALLHMGASLASTCRPYWQIRRPSYADTTGLKPNELVHDPASKVQDAVTLFLPDVGTLDREAAREKLQAIRPPGARPLDLVTGAAVKGANPFVMVAYATSGTRDLEDILSLGYHKEPEIRAWMDMAERHDGESWFSTRDNQKGLGYLDPEYVRTPRLSRLRWKPWQKEDAGAAAAAETDVIDAVLYALYEPPADLTKELAALGWSLPVAKEGPQKRYTFLRTAYADPAGNWQRHKGVREDPRLWGSGDLLAIALHRVVDVLAGRGDKQLRENTRWPEWRAALLAESAVFWGQVGTHLGFHPGSQRYRELMEAYRGQVSALVKATPRSSDEYPVVERMLERLDGLLKA